MTTAMIKIHKQAGQKKDAIRVNTLTDIPDSLKDTIKIEGDSLILECVEGIEKASIGSVIGYEESSMTSTGWNAWCIGNASTNLVEIDGVFYKKATIMTAQKVGNTYPEFLEGANIRKNEDGSWTIKTDWGESTGFPGEAYWILYGIKGDGTPDANILTKSEKSYNEYIVCDEYGKDIGYLSDIDPV